MKKSFNLLIFVFAIIVKAQVGVNTQTPAATLDKVIEGKAVLNPQYKNLNLYDSDMNRINTNKPLEGLEQDNKHEKNNVKEQSIKR